MFYQVSYQQHLVWVKELTVKLVVTFVADTSIMDAQDELILHNLLGTAILNKAAKVIGFLSERDCLPRMIQMKYHNKVSSRVSELRSKKCVTTREKDNIMNAIEFF